MISKNNFSLLLLLLLFVSGCVDQIKSPIMPVWDVSYTVPIVNRTEIVKDRIKGTKGIFIDSSTQHLLLKFDSTRIEAKPLDEIFGSEIEYKDEFTLKTQNVDTIKFESFVSDDSVYLEEFHLKKGTLTYEVFNYLNRKVNLNITIPGFTKVSTGSIDTLKFSVIVQPNSSAKKFINLKDYKYKYSQNPLGGTNYGIYLKGYAKIDAGYSGDSVTTKVEIKDLGFNYIKGKVKPLDDEIKPKTNYVDVDEDAQDILPKVQVYGAKIILTPNTSIKNLEIRLKDFEVIGVYKAAPFKKNLKINNRTILDTIISLEQPSFVINLDDVDINDFLNPQIPESISYKGKITINPNYKSIEVTLPDTINYSVQFQIYSIFKINYVSRTDTFEVEIDDEFKKQIDKFNEARLTIEADNGLPLGFQVSGYLLDALNRKLFYFTREHGGTVASDTVFSIAAAPIDIEGKVSRSNKQQKVYVLKKEEAQKIKSAKKAIAYVVVHSTEGKKVLLRSTDRISFKASMTLNIQVR